MTADRIYNVLFLSTGNSARSILGEALLNRFGEGRFNGHSAGSTPNGRVDPMTLDILRNVGIPTVSLRSKGWDEFATPDAPKMDFVFTVCDNAAGETCPIWPGRPITAHWGIDDVAAVDGPEFLRRAAFEDALRQTRKRTQAFIKLPLSTVDRMTLASRLQGIGGMHGSGVEAPQMAVIKRFPRA